MQDVFQPLGIAQNLTEGAPQKKKIKLSLSVPTKSLFLQRNAVALGDIFISFVNCFVLCRVV